MDENNAMPEGTPTPEAQALTDAGAPAPTEQPAEPTEGGFAAGPEVPEGLKEVAPEVLAEMRARLDRFVKKGGTTVSGSEDPDSAPVADEQGRPQGDTGSGADVDWSEYDLPFSVKHLYPQAQYRQTEEGPKWVVMLDEFYSSEKRALSHGQKSHTPEASDDQMEPKNLGEYITGMVNGPEGWTVATILPGSLGQAIVLLRRKTPYVLPDPEKLKKAEEVEAPKPEELSNVEQAALDFAAGEGLTPPPLEGEDTPVAPPAIEPGTLERLALAVNEGSTLPAPIPAGIQPESEDGIVAPGVENIRQGLPKLLEGPDFGTV